MSVTYHFGYPNMQRVIAIDEAVSWIRCPIKDKL